MLVLLENPSYSCFRFLVFVCSPSTINVTDCSGPNIVTSESGGSLHQYARGFFAAVGLTPDAQSESKLQGALFSPCMSAASSLLATVQRA